MERAGWGKKVRGFQTSVTQPAAKEWNGSARVLTIEATPYISLPDHHMSF